MIGEVFKTAAGQWGFRVLQDGVEICGGGGYEDAGAAHTEMLAVLAELQPYE